MSGGAEGAREESAERELARRSDHGARALEETNGLLAALERALTVWVPPLRLPAVVNDGRRLVPRATKANHMRPGTGRGRSISRGPAVNAGVPWEGAQENRKGGQHP